MGSDIPPEDAFGNHSLVMSREEKLGFHLNVVDPETDLTTPETGPPVDTETRLTRDIAKIHQNPQSNDTPRWFSVCLLLHGGQKNRLFTNQIGRASCRERV